METIEQTDFWEKVELVYFVPKNKEGLRQLVGKPVRTLLFGNPYITIYAGIVGGRHEFIEQHHNYDRPSKRFYHTKNISGLQVDTNLELHEQGIDVNSVYHQLYKPGSEDYTQRCAWLEEWNMWRNVN